MPKLGETWFNKKMRSCMGNVKGKTQQEIRSKFKQCAKKVARSRKK